MRLSSSGSNHQQIQHEEGEKKCLNSELWHACAGPLVCLPSLGSRVIYFPQGHSKQVAASTNKEIDSHIPNYPNLPAQLICQLHNVTMHADVDTNEVYAQMTLQPLSPQEQKEVYLMPAELGTANKQPTNYFCKTLTASDTSTHGGFSVPRRAAEKVFPPLDFSQQPPAQELIARDLHDNEWKFKHIFRGQPKRHLLTTGWSIFVSAKRLVAGDSVLFIWNEKNQLFLGIRRANRPQTVMPSSVLSSDSMHIGLLAAAAHAAATNSRFTIFYNPRASPSEFVIPLGKYVKAVYHTRVSVGMRFRMLFETEESSVRRYMGTIIGIGDLDPVRWPNSHWRSVKVGWDESTAGEKQPRVSLWEIEPLTTFPMYPFPFPLLKRPWTSGLPDPSLMWLQGAMRDPGIQSLNFQGFGGTPWMQPRLDDSSMAGLHPNLYQAMATAALQDMRTVDPTKAASPSLIQFQQPRDVPRQTFLHRFQENGGPQQPQILQQQDSPHIMFSNGIANTVAVSDMQNILSSLSRDNMSRSHHAAAPSPSRPVHCSSLPQVESFGTSDPNVSELASMLPPFPGRDSYSAFGGGNDPQSSFSFGVNIDSSSLMPPFAASDFDNAGAVNFPLNSEMTTSSSVDENGFFQSLEHVDRVNPQSETFVKVHKPGSLGRSLDISKFNSYNELRGELACMFGLEGLLESPQRSGWQLVFVDRENDVLLLGDDPWQEFVNDVGYIKILSTTEVLQMGDGGTAPASSIPTQRNLKIRKTCDDYAALQDLRNPSNGIAPIGSLDY